jgi:glyoxylase-like metal-dependent hydrolase (beta-lactamase superfamily II)
VETRIHPVRIPFTLPINKDKRADRLVFSYLMTGGQLCLVDTGPAGGEQRIVEALRTMGRSPADISLIVNTHEHPDHIGGNAFFNEASHPTFACHADAVRWIENLEIQRKERPIYGFDTLAGRKGVHVERVLHDGDRIDLGQGMVLEVIFCPGHSPGSISLFCPAEGALIVGDVVQPVDGLPLYLDQLRTAESLRRLMGFLPGVEKMYVAWVEKPYVGSEIREVLEASLGYLDHVDEATKEAVSKLGADASPEEITREVLIRLNLIPPPVMPLTVTSIMAHVLPRR